MKQYFSRSQRFILVGILFVAALLLFVNLPKAPFWDFDESTYANVIRDTQQSGDLLTLSFIDHPWYEKPPLYFWIGMGVNKVVPDPQWAYRIPAALGGLAAIALTILIALELSGSTLVAAIAGAILLTTAPFIDAARQVRLDAPVIAMILLSVYSFLRGRRSPKWYLGVGVAIGIGIMLKSVVALLGGIFFLAYSIVYRDLKWLKSVHLWLGALAGFAIAAPWHIYQTVVHGGVFWHDYLFYHVFARVTTDILANSASSWTVGGYISYLARYVAPWSAMFVLVVGLSGYALMKWKDRGDIRPLLTALITALGILATFFVAASKLPYYLLPAYPFIALSVALATGYLLERFASEVSAERRIIALGIVLFILAFANTIYFWMHWTPIEHASDAVAHDEQQVGLIMAQEPDVPIYSFQYNFWDTIRWYAGRPLTKLQPDDNLSQPIYLVTWTKFMEHNSFPPQLAAHFTLLYQGPAVTLYRFSP